MEKFNYSTPTLEKIELTEIKTKEDFVFSAIVIEGDLAVSNYAESKIFFSADRITYNLLEAIREYKATKVYHIINLDDNHPYFLVDKDNQIHVFLTTYNRNGKILYSVYDCQDYFQCTD